MPPSGTWTVRLPAARPETVKANTVMPFTGNGSETVPLDACTSEDVNVAGSTGSPKSTVKSMLDAFVCPCALEEITGAGLLVSTASRGMVPFPLVIMSLM